MSDGLVEHFFRHEYGRVVSALVRRVGVAHLDEVEDAVQSAMMTAVEAWRRDVVPERPGAWLHRVAQNRLTSALRRRSGRARLLREEPSSAEPDLPPPAGLRGEVEDDLLRMMFVCCDPAIPVDSQLVLALKVLCGFGVREIATRLFTSEANVYKRLGRARSRLRTSPSAFDSLAPADLLARRSAVHQVLYLLFTEGYLSSRADTTIRRELCADAIRLTTILASHPAGDEPETRALLALMHLHGARMSARQDASGGILLLQEQDRSTWDESEIEVGLVWLARSASGDRYTRFHAEAAIAAEHCLAPSFDDTRWGRVAELYEALAASSPVHRLNHAVAVAEHRGPEAGLAALEGFEPPAWLAGSYQWFAVLSDLHRRADRLDTAARYAALATATAPTAAIEDALRRRLAP